MIERKITNALKEQLSMFPVVFLTGPRQSGKSTLLKEVLKDYSYVNLEHPNALARAVQDPEGFLDQLGRKVVIDEVQNFPELFSYIQIRVDEVNEPGMFVLSGSQNFLIMEKVSQTLAGRVGVLTLLPLSYQEEQESKVSEKTAPQWLLKGGYPRLYDQPLKIDIFYQSYTATYIERDVRKIKNIMNLSEFQVFLRVCAGRVGQQIDYIDIANIVGVKVQTIKSWFSVLEASYVAFFLKPYYNNLDKRLTKSPKLYFYDTGLVANLLGVKTVEQLITHPIYGHLFENAIIVEKMKDFFNSGLRENFYFFRDSNRLEIDLIIDSANEVNLFEIKSCATPKPSFADVILKLRPAFSKKAIGHVIHGGKDEFDFKDVQFLPWNKGSRY
ncbi:MAG: ATP-binding protein [Candidatus Ancillula sp.]|jgi:predicted AAA+ superfamily ATPase|nr:ATP-binding protein [Candidatus Ancillula sp.]